jgi:diadenosine tetraphosphate (Ap4A) HIT family hydrolase
MVREDFILYEDSLIQMHLSSSPVAKGHIEVRPVKKSKVLQDLSDDEVTHLFFGASYAATALFEMVGAQGTNIILNESDDQLCVHVIARNEGDGLNFLWQPTKGNPQELAGVSKSIKDKIDYFVWARDNPKEAAKTKKGPSVSSSPTETIKPEIDKETGEEKINYLLKHLQRVP